MGDSARDPGEPPHRVPARTAPGRCRERAGRYRSRWTTSTMSSASRRRTCTGSALHTARIVKSVMERLGWKQVRKRVAGQTNKKRFYEKGHSGREWTLVANCFEPLAEPKRPSIGVKIEAMRKAA